MEGFLQAAPAKGPIKVAWQDHSVPGLASPNSEMARQVDQATSLLHPVRGIEPEASKYENAPTEAPRPRGSGDKKRWPVASGGPRFHRRMATTLRKG